MIRLTVSDKRLRIEVPWGHEVAYAGGTLVVNKVFDDPYLGKQSILVGRVEDVPGLDESEYVVFHDGARPAPRAVFGVFRPSGEFVRAFASHRGADEYVKNDSRTLIVREITLGE